jgi:ethanolamine ammonia-lyase small subunit
MVDNPSPLRDAPGSAETPGQAETGAPSSAVRPASSSLVSEDGWFGLRRYTPARLALGRVGASLPTREVLAFSMAHAGARDAVHLPFDADALELSLQQAGFSTVQVRSRATHRAEYLRRPDLGRRLHPDCKALLVSAEPAPAHRLTLVIGDGLSSLAPTRHALPLMLELRAQLDPLAAGWQLDSLVIARQARVGLADEIAELRGAEAAVILLGERPGLSSPDSLGIYMTYAPRPGRTDAERNCLSNIREAGLSYAEAAYKLVYLLEQARLAGRSGVAIKDGSEWTPPAKIPALSIDRLTADHPK